MVTGGFVLDIAQEKGLAGYARNGRGGSVTIFVQGAEARVKDGLGSKRGALRPTKD